jgi:hypothetical protein
LPYSSLPDFARWICNAFAAFVALFEGGDLEEHLAITDIEHREERKKDGQEKAWIDPADASGNVLVGNRDARHG